MANYIHVTTHVSGEVDVSAAEFWKLLHDWPAVMKWAGGSPFGPRKVELRDGHNVNVLPCTRVIHVADPQGGPPTFVETLLHADPQARRVYYNVEGESAGGMRNYLCTTFVDEVDADHAYVTCASQFDVPDEASATAVKEFMEMVYRDMVIAGIAAAVKRERATATVL